MTHSLSFSLSLSLVLTLHGALSPLILLLFLSVLIVGLRAFAIFSLFPLFHSDHLSFACYNHIFRFSDLHSEFNLLNEECAD